MYVSGCCGWSPQKGQRTLTNQQWLASTKARTPSSEGAKPIDEVSRSGLRFKPLGISGRRIHPGQDAVDQSDEKHQGANGQPTADTNSKDRWLVASGVCTTAAAPSCSLTKEHHCRKLSVQTRTGSPYTMSTCILHKSQAAERSCSMVGLLNKLAGSKCGMSVSFCSATIHRVLSSLFHLRLLCPFITIYPFSQTPNFGPDET